MSFEHDDPPACGAPCGAPPGGRACATCPLNRSEAPVWQRAEIESPCVKICVIHRAAEICIGCYRTAEEIGRWSSYSPAERRALMEALPSRAPLLTQRRGGRAARRAD